MKIHLCFTPTFLPHGVEDNFDNVLAVQVKTIEMDENSNTIDFQELMSTMYPGATDCYIYEMQNVGFTAKKIRFAVR